MADRRTACHPATILFEEVCPPRCKVASCPRAAWARRQASWAEECRREGTALREEPARRLISEVALQCEVDRHRTFVANFLKIIQEYSQFLKFAVASRRPSELARRPARTWAIRSAARYVSSRRPSGRPGRTDAASESARNAQAITRNSSRAFTMGRDESRRRR